MEHEVEALASRREALALANENGKATAAALNEFTPTVEKLRADVRREREPRLPKKKHQPVLDEDTLPQHAKACFEKFADEADTLLKYEQQRADYDRRQLELQLREAQLARLQDAALSARSDFDVAMTEYELQMARVEAVVARRQKERERLEAEVETARRKLTRTMLEADAVDVWGPDHASRAPKAVFDMRGPLPPSPPASPPGSPPPSPPPQLPPMLR
eukprot:4762490-Prymnesium_polylepis.1